MIPHADWLPRGKSPPIGRTTPPHNIRQSTLPLRGKRGTRLAENPMREIVMATPAISDGMNFVRTNRHAYGIGE